MIPLLLILLIVGAALIFMSAVCVIMARKLVQADNELEYLRWKEWMRKHGEF